MADHSYISTNIQSAGGCRSVAITESNADVILAGRCGWAGTRLSQDFYDTMHRLHEANVYIEDVHITEKGSWTVISDDFDVDWHNIPTSLETTIRRYISDFEQLRCITFDDFGNWVIISEQYFSASSTNIMTWLKEGADKFGRLHTVHMTNNAMAAVFQRGYKYQGSVPTTLKEALNSDLHEIYTVKFAGSAWFYADRNGDYCRFLL